MPLGDQAPHVDEQPVGGDAARHEVVVQVAEDVQLLCGDLHKRTTWETEAFWMHCECWCPAKVDVQYILVSHDLLK